MNYHRLYVVPLFTRLMEIFHPRQNAVYHGESKRRGEKKEEDREKTGVTIVAITINEKWK